MKERLRYARRFVVLATVAFATSWVVLAHPAYADPGGTAVPDGGAQPVPSGALTPPSSTKPGNPDIPPVAQGPLAQQVTSEEAAVEQIGEQLKQVKLDLDQVKTVKASARDAWSKADDEVTALKAKAEQEAADAAKPAKCQRRLVRKKSKRNIPAGNNIAIRFHTQPWDEPWYDVADEVGLLIVEECAV